jgi:hypothetical protein
MGFSSHGTSGPPRAVPELAIEARSVPVPKAKPRSDANPESPLELAVDPRALVQERSQGLLGFPVTPAFVSLAGPSGSPELALDARLLADYGDLPTHWMLSPLYAYRVVKRRRELRVMIAGRRQEAARTLEEMEDALVTFAERARAAAETRPEYAKVVAELRDAEGRLRSRDRVLAAEQDAQSARRSQVESRISNLEGELGRARTAERALAMELAQAQIALAREEARLKRAEVEVRSARQHPGQGEEGG